MSTLRRDEKPTLAQRLSLWAMTGGIVLLMGSLVGAFVIVPVLLVQSSRRKEAEQAETRRRDELKGEKKAAAAAKAPEPVAAKPPPAAPKPPRVEPQPIPVAPPPPPAPPAAAPKGAAAVDPEGFIRNWLVLAPVRTGATPFSGTQEIHKAQIPNEARLRPKENDRVSFPDRERVWQRHVAPGYFVDLQKIVGAGRSDDVVGYAVCYVHAPQAMSGLKLQMGSNDQAKVYLNGAHLLVWDKTRSLAKDQSTANDVQLKRGENLLVFKVVNERGGWSGCVRFTDRNNQPVKTLQISLTPQ